MASGRQPIFDTSATSFTPLASSRLASSPSSSFCVAHGMAMSTLTSHGFLPAKNFELGNFLAYGSTTSLFDARSSSM